MKVRLGLLAASMSKRKVRGVRRHDRRTSRTLSPERKCPKTPHASFILGTFGNGDLFSYGDLPIGQYSLKTTEGYPKHMYVLFKLVETDSDGRETARDLTKAIGGLAQGIVSTFAGAMAGATAGMLVSAIGGFFQGIIDEDEFPWRHDGLRRGVTARSRQRTFSRCTPLRVSSRQSPCSPLRQRPLRNDSCQAPPD
ncbi:hypothetical protein MASR1M101_18020 [Gemmatimonas sp.]